MARRGLICAVVAMATIVGVLSLTACGSATVSSTVGSSSPAGGTSSATATGADFQVEIDVKCTPSHEQEVTWTLENPGPELEVISATVDGVIKAEPVFSPSPVPQGGATTASLTVPGGLQGDVDLHLTVSFGSPVTTGGTTQLEGNC